MGAIIERRLILEGGRYAEVLCGGDVRSREPQAQTLAACGKPMVYELGAWHCPVHRDWGTILPREVEPNVELGYN
jgi:hypothetical protein